jgi:hypothetical protein
VVIEIVVVSLSCFRSLCPQRLRTLPQISLQMLEMWHETGLQTPVQMLGRQQFS